MTIPEILECLAVDPRVPGFQALTFFRAGQVNVQHKFGVVTFASTGDFTDWLLGLKNRAADKPEGNAS